MPRGLNAWGVCEWVGEFFEQLLVEPFQWVGLSLFVVFGIHDRAGVDRQQVHPQFAAQWLIPSPELVSSTGLKCIDVQIQLELLSVMPPAMQ